MPEDHLTVAPPPQSDDPDAIIALREALWSAGFTAARVAEAMRTEGIGFIPRPTQVPVLLRVLPEGIVLSTLVKLFLAAATVDRGEAEKALAPIGVEGATALGLIHEDDTGGVAALCRLAPAGDLLMAFDLVPGYEVDLPPDVVVGVSSSSRYLADTTVRRPVGSALDIGTGSGVQALLAAGHATTVTATDTNSRALAYTRFNALLNGLDNIELLEGDLLSPVAGRSFDLIVSNPPFVVSPDSDYLYRDSPLPRDSVSRELVRDTAGMLKPGGFAHLMVSWVHDFGGDWTEPLREWVNGLGCDAWLLHFNTDDPYDHSSSWNLPLERDTARYIATVERWLDWMATEGIEAVSYGSVILRRRDGTNWTQAQSLAGTNVGPANDQVRSLFTARDLIDGVGGPGGLLDQRLVLDAEHRMDQSLHCRNGRFDVESAVFHLKRGLHFRAAVDVYSAQLMSRFDGQRTVREAIEEAAVVLDADVDHQTLVDRSTTLVGVMLETGFLHPIAVH